MSTTFGILNALEALEIAYNEMKEQLVAGNQNADTGLPATALVTQVRESLDDIQEIMQRNESIRKRKRQKKHSFKQTEDLVSDEEIKSQTIKDKRKAIKSKAIKVVKKKKLSPDAALPKDQIGNTAKPIHTPKKI